VTILAKTLHGSRMYGLDNPLSDVDHKAIHLPALHECLLLRAPRNVNTKDESGSVKTEFESFALQEFMALASRGEDVALCMLHSPDSAVYQTSLTFDTLRRERHRFYTKSMSGMCGFSRSMAAKYGLRADRMGTVEAVIKVLEGMIADGVAKLGQEWSRLPELPHTTKGENLLDRNADKRVYTVVGKGLTAGIAPAYALGIMEKVRDSYGERVKAAHAMDGQDRKAVSHSFRVGYQLRTLFNTGTFSFPLAETPFIRAVKEGRLNYVTDGLDVRLNDLIAEVEELAAKSTFPDKVDQSWCDNVILEAYDQTR
jgi:hypothetical protein